MELTKVQEDFIIYHFDHSIRKRIKIKKETIRRARGIYRNIEIIFR